ncbi:MAG: M3 family oligoendopeptidase [Alphaproteobacteria bacterium]
MLSDASSADKILKDLPEWNLSALYAGPDDSAFAADLKKAGENAATFAKAFHGKIIEISKGPDAGEKLGRAVQAYEALSDLLGRLGSYAGLYYAGDNADGGRAKFFGDTQAQLNDIATGLLFFELEVNQIGDKALEVALATQALAHYSPWILDIRKERPYQLAEEIERLLHEKSMTGAAAWNRLFDQTIVGLRFDVDGQELAIEPTLNHLLLPDGAKRQAAAEALAKTFAKHTDTFALITNTLAKDHEISDRWRGFNDIAASRHLGNRVEQQVVETLVDTVTKAYPRLSHRYYALKAKWLGMDVLNHWDRNAPLPEEDDRLIQWPRARAAVLDAYRAFSPLMADTAAEFFDRNWIDAAVRPGKSPGAFYHPTVPSAHPFVLLNYQGRPRDVMTLAHELGHGVHQVLAASQGALMAPTPLTLAETASVFGEMLTFRALLASATEPGRRKAMIAGKVEDMLNTVVRQIAFYTFERRVHTARRKGELTPEKLGEIWLDVSRESLGDAVKLGPGYETFWCYIPHFIHSPFYVYAYAFGDCLVNSLYAVYESAPDGFAEKYLDLLRAGGTKHHSDLLAPFGLDARQPTFWQAGLNLIEGMIDELEAMG